MVTFMVGSTRCKAFGEHASTIQNTSGKKIEVSARKGSFQGTTEYSVEALKTIDGNLIALKDTRSVSTNEYTSKSAPGPQATGPHVEMDNDAFEALLRGAFGPGSHSVEGEVRQPPLNPGLEQSKEDKVDPSQLDTPAQELTRGSLQGKLSRLLTAAGDKERAVAIKVHQLLTSLE
jgi:hypothetical protein